MDYSDGEYRAVLARITGAWARGDDASAMRELKEFVEPVRLPRWSTDQEALEAIEPLIAPYRRGDASRMAAELRADHPIGS